MPPCSAIESLEFRLERVKRLSNARFDFLDRLNKSEFLSNGYVNGWSDVHTHFVSGFGGPTFCAIYRVQLHSKNEVHLGWNERVVFVEVAEIGHSLCPSASIVRLQLLDTCYVSGIKPLQVGGLATKKALRAAFNRKLSFTLGSPVIQLRESSDQIVKRGSKTIHDLPRQDMRQIGHSGRAGLNRKQASATLRKLLNNSLVVEPLALSYDPLSLRANGLEIFQLFSCPSYFDISV